MTYRISILTPHPQYPAVPASILPLRRLAGRSVACSVGLVPGNSFTGHDLGHLGEIWKKMQYMWHNIWKCVTTILAYDFTCFPLFGARGPGQGFNFHIIFMFCVICCFIWFSYSCKFLVSPYFHLHNLCNLSRNVDSTPLRSLWHIKYLSWSHFPNSRRFQHPSCRSDGWLVARSLIRLLLYQATHSEVMF